jgi:glyoxylase-like metal-dependent hydrolase (beta-lactamase superfamily II)
MPTFALSRREMLVGAGSAALAVGFVEPAMAAGEIQLATGQNWTGWNLGDFRVLAVSDGKLGLGSPANWFAGLPVEKIEAVLKENFLDTTSISLAENILLLDTGQRLVMFDTGTGGNPMLGDTAGRLMASLAAAGVDPAAVDDVILSHGHPDHIFGLLGPDGKPAFPNAQVHISEVDFRFCTDDANASDPKVGAFVPEMKRQLLGVGDRIAMIRDGLEIVPGVTAIAAPGHTFGHMVFMLESGGKTLLNAADLAHHYAIFTRHPEVNFVSDQNPQMMAATRMRMFDMIATDRLSFVGYHFPFPGYGHLAKAQQGFEYIPASLDTI